jgi:hypothetical protein
MRRVFGVHVRRPGGGVRLTLAVALSLVASLAWAPTGSAATPAGDETALALAYAPVVRLTPQPGSCGIRQPYKPIDVNLLMSDDEVALRGPWDTTSIVKVAPTVQDLARGLFGYYLDFPGDALRPGCSYEQWQQRLVGNTPPTTYARVVTEAGFPNMLALQYWFFYVYNDWNNKHEGDWEMIQLVFDTATPAQALARGPAEVGYSQHSSAERARWDDPKLEKADGTHPVVYPSVGSQANFFQPQLYLMRSSAEGVGCDNATGASVSVRPVVAVVPTAPADYLPLYPWLGFDGRWGERHAAFFNGPTGPNLKDQWTHPISWAQTTWRDTSFAIASRGTVGIAATDFFCQAVSAGSEVLRQAKADPGPALLVLAGLVALAVWGLSRTSWQPSAPLRIARQRRWGQLLSASARIYAQRPGVLLGIGLLFVPLGVLITLIQVVLFRLVAFTSLVNEAGTRNGFVASLAFALGLVFTLFGLVVVQAATASALVEIDAGRPVSALSAYRSLAGRLRSLAVALAVVTLTQIVLDLTIALIPVAAYLLVRWSLLGVVVGVETDPSPGLLRRSATLSRRNWWRVASVTVGVTGLALLAGPFVGALALVATGAAFDLVNLIAALIYVAALPFAAAVMTYLYYDLRVRSQITPVAKPAADDLPAEI